MTAIGDPWRLCCPECGNHSFDTSGSGWWCHSCEHKVTALWDKLDGRLLSRSEVSA